MPRSASGYALGVRGLPGLSLRISLFRCSLLFVSKGAVDAFLTLYTHHLEDEDPGSGFLGFSTQAGVLTLGFMTGSGFRKV